MGLTTSGRMLAGAILGWAVVACGDSTGVDRGPDVQNALVFEREDGTRITFPATTYIWCGPWEPGVVPTTAVHVHVGGAESGWSLRAVLADVTVGQPLTFPNTFIWDQPRRADMFILDPPNELSTQEDESSGQVTFQELRCTTGTQVRFTVNATVGSELAGSPTMRVTGSFSGRIGTSPF